MQRPSEGPSLSIYSHSTHESDFCLSLWDSSANEITADLLLKFKCWHYLRFSWLFSLWSNPWCQVTLKDTTGITNKSGPQCLATSVYGSQNEIYFYPFLPVWTDPKGLNFAIFWSEHTFQYFCKLSLYFISLSPKISFAHFLWCGNITFCYNVLEGDQPHQTLH